MDELSDNENMNMEEEISEVESNGNDSEDPEHYNIDDVERTWIQWFCQLDGHEFLVEISPEWLESNSNLIGITKQFSDHK